MKIHFPTSLKSTAASFIRYVNESQSSRKKNLHKHFEYCTIWTIFSWDELLFRKITSSNAKPSLFRGNIYKATEMLWLQSLLTKIKYSLCDAITSRLTLLHYQMLRNFRNYDVMQAAYFNFTSHVCAIQSMKFTRQKQILLHAIIFGIELWAESHIKWTSYERNNYYISTWNNIEQLRAWERSKNVLSVLDINWKQ